MPPTTRSPHPTAVQHHPPRLSAGLGWHPYWNTARSVPAAPTELRQPTLTRGAALAA
ncbi:hypothetical protein ACIBBD_27510 [Streptomyces sp. NPDC051315]|uniref:hypothetical protein n=1 Tax=Streptomyces sp. NPDC051315 TaxID=3365650 RepID=UPI0037BDEF3E